MTARLELQNRCAGRSPVGGFDSRPPPLRCRRTNPGRDEEGLDGRPAMRISLTTTESSSLTCSGPAPQEGGADLMLELHEVLIRESGGRVR